MPSEVAGLLVVFIVGGFAVAFRMGWRPRLWDRFRAHRQLRRTTRWLKKHHPSGDGTWTGPEWLEAQDAVGGKFVLYPSNLRQDGESKESQSGV